MPIVFLENQPWRPFVELRIGESVGYFLLDTGAAGHVMSDWFFRSAFPGRPVDGRSASAVDFAGVPIPVTIVGGVEAQWADGDRSPMSFAVGPFSRPADADGLAGILSPQLLFAAAGSVELDFPARVLRFWPDAGGVGHAYSLEERTLRACVASSRGTPVYAWATGLEGEPSWAMMDTGSPITAVSSESPAGKRLLPRSRAIGAGRGASNAPVEARGVIGAMDFGGVVWRVDLAVMRLPFADCGSTALLGMNVLGRCAVTLSRHQGFVRCRP